MVGMRADCTPAIGGVLPVATQLMAIGMAVGLPGRCGGGGHVSARVDRVLSSEVPTALAMVVVL